MKNILMLFILGLLVAHTAQAQFQNKGAFVNITSGSSVKALDGVVNTNGSTLTLDGTLNTPADLSNSTGATLQGDGQYFIGGNWTNSATFFAGTSTVTFDGEQNSTATSGGEAFHNVALNKSGGNNLVLADAMTIGNTLDFQAADNHVDLGEHNLQVVDITGYDATRHVRTTGTGFLVRTVGGSPVVFPVGNSAYDPATLTNVGTADQYFLRVNDAVLSGGDTGAPLTADAVGRSWFVEEGMPDGSDLSISLQWNGNEEPPTFNRSMAYVSHFVTGSWDMQPTGAASGADPYTLSRSGITSLSPFAIFDGDFMPVIDISGIILWETDGVSGVKDATVALSGDDTDSDLTPLDGTYALTATSGSNFAVTPTKNINKLNGITSADVTAIQQHVTYINLLPGPFKRIAADVNKSNSITTFDATILNQALLGNPAAQNIMKSWRFVPASYSFPNPNIPWGFPENIILTGASGSVSGQDFNGIKLGDVVSTWANPANFGAGEPLVLWVQDRMLQAGEDVIAEFRADQLDELNSFQFALHFDPEQLQLVQIEPLTELPVSMGNFGTFNVAEGEIRMVWAQATSVLLSEAAPVFRLRFKALENGALLSEVLQLNEAALPGHAYNSAYVESGVELRYSTSTSTDEGLDSWDDREGLSLQNWPNPFKDFTTLTLVLPAEADAELRVLDVAGRVLFSEKSHFAAGKHEVALRLDGASGVLLTELVLPTGVLTKKMLAVHE